MDIPGEYVHVFERLRGVTKANGTHWAALCPAHPDRNPSLSLTIGSKNELLVKCHAGCEFKAIPPAIGLKDADFFPLPEGARPRRTVVATYQYTDEQGKLLYEIVRYLPKDFRARKPGSSPGEWDWNLGNVRRVLYQLPLIAASAEKNRAVVIAEGELDANNLISLGLVATTNPGGSGRWREEYSECLRGRRVVVLADNDEPGRKHAHMVAASLRRRCPSVKLVELPGLQPGGDVSDWLLANKGKAEDQVKKLVEIVKGVPEYPTAAPEPVVNGQSNDEAPAILKLAGTTVDVVGDDLDVAVGKRMMVALEAMFGLIREIAAFHGKGEPALVSHECNKVRAACVAIQDVLGS